MKKEFIRFFMRDKKQNITLPYDQAFKVLTSQQQQIMIYDAEGKWTGVMINKAEIKGTDHDFEEEDRLNYNKNQLPEPMHKAIDIDKYKPDFLKKKDEPTTPLK